MNANDFTFFSQYNGASFFDVSRGILGALLGFEKKLSIFITESSVAAKKPVIKICAFGDPEVEVLYSCATVIAGNGRTAVTGNGATVIEGGGDVDISGNKPGKVIINRPGDVKINARGADVTLSRFRQLNFNGHVITPERLKQLLALKPASEDEGVV